MKSFSFKFQFQSIPKRQACLRGFLSGIRIRSLRIDNRQSTIGNAFRLFVDTLREIFDENAYARFLQRYRLPASRESYKAFVHENSRRKECKARCC